MLAEAAVAPGSLEGRAVGLRVAAPTVRPPVAPCSCIAIATGLGQRPVPVQLALAKIALVDARGGAEDQTPFARDL